MNSAFDVRVGLSIAQPSRAHFLRRVFLMIFVNQIIVAILLCSMHFPTAGVEKTGTEEILWNHYKSSVTALAMFAAAVGEKLMVWDKEGKRTEVPVFVGQIRSGEDSVFARFQFLDCSYGGDWSLRIWKFGHKEPHATLKGHGFVISGMELVNDGKLIVSGGWRRRSTSCEPRRRS